MNDVKTLLSSKETKRLMRQRLTPITTSHKSNSNSLFKLSINSIGWKPPMLVTTLILLVVNLAYAMGVANVNDPQMGERNSANNQTYVSNFDYNKKEVKQFSPLDGIKMPTVKPLNPAEVIKNRLGSSTIKIRKDTLVRYGLPNDYYNGIDFSSFQPFMSYTCITNRDTPAWHIVNSEKSYTDNNGFRRYKINKNELSIDGQDDYVVALGTFYKKKGSCGDRYLIVTSTGMYTAITGDEKSNHDTDSMNMFSRHGDGKAGLIEWIVDQESGNMPRSILSSGTITAGPVKALQGEILYIYKIE